jgi:hypothetical protein
LWHHTHGQNFLGFAALQISHFQVSNAQPKCTQAEEKGEMEKEKICGEKGGRMKEEIHNIIYSKDSYPTSDFMALNSY